MVFVNKTIIYKRWGTNTPLETGFICELTIIMRRKYFTSKKNIKRFRKIIELFDKNADELDIPMEYRFQGWELRKKAIEKNNIYFTQIKQEKDRNDRIQVDYITEKTENRSRNMKEVSLSYIGIDWDNITPEELKRRKKEFVRGYPYSITKSSYKPNSYHVKIFEKADIKTHFGERRRMHDDPNRIKLDKLREKEGIFFNVLFDKKMRIL